MGKNIILCPLLPAFFSKFPRILWNIVLALSFCHFSLLFPCPFFLFLTFLLRRALFLWYFSPGGRPLYYNQLYIRTHLIFNRNSRDNKQNNATVVDHWFRPLQTPDKDRQRVSFHFLWCCRGTEPYRIGINNRLCRGSEWQLISCSNSSSVNWWSDLCRRAGFESWLRHICLGMLYWRKERRCSWSSLFRIPGREVGNCTIKSVRNGEVSDFEMRPNVQYIISPFVTGSNIKDWFTPVVSSSLAGSIG